jgi:N-acetylglucosamine-6-phosphate deacetylase
MSYVVQRRARASLKSSRGYLTAHQEWIVLLPVNYMPEINAYTADRIFTGTSWLTGQAVLIEEGRIKNICALTDIPTGVTVQHFTDGIIAPAFIDLQIYGAAEKLFAVYPDTDALYKLYAYCNAGGAAWCLPTVATNTTEVFYQCIDAVKAYWKMGGKGVGGLHLEGPWINSVKRGAHVAALIHAPTIAEVQELLDYGKGVIKMVTLAPEICSPAIIDVILPYNIVISAGHSNATYEEAKNGFARGIRAVTHLYNAMSPLQHRAPGLVGAAMDDDSVMASIIPDGHHVDHAAVRIAKQVMKERLFVITDAVTTTDRGYYQHQPAGNKYEADGILSGSALTMNMAVQNLVQHAGVELSEALRMCSLYPAQVMNAAHEFGKIEKGYSASLVVLDAALNVLRLIQP